jgi:16S rRNA (guanine527-N7)-methyltransferase
MHIKLAEGLELLGLEPEKRLIRFLNELQLFNKKMNLVRGTEEEIIVHHVLDSLAGLKRIRDLGGAGTYADIGSGAGFPAIPLKIYYPDIKGILVERSGKRAGFLRSTAAVLGIHDIEIFEGQLEECKEKFSLITLRAFREFRDFLPQLSEVLAPDGHLVFYKGKRSVIEEEIRELPKLWDAEIVRLEVPFSDRERHLLILNQAAG